MEPRVTLKTKKLGGLNFEKPGKYGEILDENSKRLGIIVYIDLRGF